MKKKFNEGNQIHNFMSISGSGTVINYVTGSDFLTSYGSGSESTSQKVTVPMVPVPQHWFEIQSAKSKYLLESYRGFHRIVRLIYRQKVAAVDSFSAIGIPQLEDFPGTHSHYQ